MRPATKRSIHEWAEAERVVPRGTSPQAGRWRSKPFQRPVLEAITDPVNTEGVLYVAASQLGGKTEILLNGLGYFVHSDPSPQIFVTYSVDMAAKLSKHRVASTIRESPALRGLVSEARSRDSANTILDKVYVGGQATFVGANSPGGLSMYPKRVAWFDECDRYPVSAGTEGDSIALTLARLEAYWNRIKVYVTSPGIREVSRSWRLWQQSDRREWFVACSDCGTDQFLKWSQVHWDKDESGAHRPETAIYACERCGSVWGDAERWKLCDAGRYKPTAPFAGLAGFRISALAIAGVSLEHVVRKWLGAQGNPEELKVFKNTVLAEWWDYEYGRAPDETGLLQRREIFPERDGLVEVPAQCALITAGVDTQDNRLEVSVYAWGRGEEAWCLWHEVIFGDPSALSTWDALDVFLRRPWPRALGGADFIRGTCVDTGGHHTQAAYEFCGPRFRRVTPDGGRSFVFAIKGQTGSGEVWPRQASKVTTKVPLWPIRVDVCKSQLYSRLAIASPGPGYYHFSFRQEKAFFDELLAEKCERTLNKRTRKPQDIWKLKQPGLANEKLDCANYAYAALCGLRAMGFDLDAEVLNLPKRPVFVLTGGSVSPVAPQPPPVDPGRMLRDQELKSWLPETRGWLR